MADDFANIELPNYHPPAYTAEFVCPGCHNQRDTQATLSCGCTQCEDCCDRDISTGAKCRICNAAQVELATQPISVAAHDMLQNLLDTRVCVSSDLERVFVEVVTNVVLEGYKKFNDQATRCSPVALSQTDLDRIKATDAIDILVAFVDAERVADVIADQHPGGPARVIISFNQWGTRPENTLHFLQECMAGSPLSYLVSDVAIHWYMLRELDGFEILTNTICDTCEHDTGTEGAESIECARIRIDFKDYVPNSHADELRDPQYFQEATHDNSPSLQGRDGSGSGRADAGGKRAVGANLLPEFSGGMVADRGFDDDDDSSSSGPLGRNCLCSCGGGDGGNLVLGEYIPLLSHKPTGGVVEDGGDSNSANDSIESESSSSTTASGDSSNAPPLHAKRRRGRKRQVKKASSSRRLARLVQRVQQGEGTNLQS